MPLATLFAVVVSSVVADFLGLELVDDSDSVWLLLVLLWLCSLLAKSSQHVYFRLVIKKRIKYLNKEARDFQNGA